MSQHPRVQIQHWQCGAPELVVTATTLEHKAHRRRRATMLLITVLCLLLPCADLRTSTCPRNQPIQHSCAFKHQYKTTPALVHKLPTAKVRVCYTICAATPLGPPLLTHKEPSKGLIREAGAINSMQGAPPVTGSCCCRMATNTRSSSSVLGTVWRRPGFRVTTLCSVVAQWVACSWQLVQHTLHHTHGGAYCEVHLHARRWQGGCSTRVEQQGAW